MTPTWLDTLLVPHLVHPTPNASPRPLSLQEATALILAGRGLWLDRFRDASELPVDVLPAQPETALWLGADHYYAGDTDRALDLFLRACSATSGPADLRAAAAVLASVASSDLRRHDRAADIVRAVHDQLQEEIEQATATRDPVLQRAGAVMALHLGWRHAEAGRWHEAVASSESAVSLVQGDESPVARVVDHVAGRNSFKFRFHDGPVRAGELEALQRRGPVRSLQEPTLRLASALSSLVERETRARLEGPFAAGVRWVAEDEVARGLWTAVLRSECLGDDDLVRSTRRERARARALIDSDDVEGLPATVFRDLLECGAAKELSRAARWQLRRGPLEKLAGEVARTARSTWLARHEQGILALLASAGELAPQPDAGTLVDRLLGIVEGPDRTGRTYAADLAALDALPMVLEAATDETHHVVAERLLASNRGPHVAASVIHALPRVLNVLRWEHLDPAVVSAWKQVVEDRSPENDDREQVRAALVSALSQVDPQWARQVAERAYDSRRSPRWAAVLVDLDVALPDGLARDIAIRAIERVGHERQQAAEGHLSIGDIRDALLLAALVIDRPELPGWSEVCWYLRDSNVGIDEKERVANLIASRHNVVDEEMREELSAAVADGLRGRGFWDMSTAEHEAVGAGLRLAFAFGLGDAERLRGPLLELVHHMDPAERIEGCWTLPYATALGPWIAQQALHLTFDSHHEVRAAAAASCLRVASEHEGAPPQPQDPLIHERIDRLFTDPGAAVPSSLLGALSGADHKARHPYLPAVSRLSTDHAAASVRRAASALVAPEEDRAGPA